MRIYDPRLGRFLSVDPLTQSYPWYSPYQYAGNKPIRYIDRDGLEEAESDFHNEMVYNTYQIKASITNTMIRLSPNREKAKLKEEFAKAGIFDETFINNYKIRLRTIVTNHPADEANPQAWFEIDNKFVIEPKNSSGREAFEAVFDVLNTLSVLPSPGSTGFLAAKGGGQILVGEFRRSMGILFNVKRLSIIGETRAALQGVQKIEDIMEAGMAFVGKNAKEIRTAKGKLEGFESTDGLRRFRPPTKKSFGGGTIQANFEQRINKDVKWGEKATESQRSNMHVVSDKVYNP